MKDWNELLVDFDVFYMDRGSLSKGEAFRRWVCVKLAEMQNDIRKLKERFSPLDEASPGGQ